MDKVLTPELIETRLSWARDAERCPCGGDVYGTALSALEKTAKSHEALRAEWEETLERAEAAEKALGQAREKLKVLRSKLLHVIAQGQPRALRYAQELFDGIVDLMESDRLSRRSMEGKVLTLKEVHDVESFSLGMLNSGQWPSGGEYIAEGIYARLEQSHEAIREQRDAYKATVDELSACLCGCPLSEHEGYGEDGISCEVEGHICVHVFHSVLIEVKDLRDKLASSKADVQTLAELRKAVKELCSRLVYDYWTSTTREPSSRWWVCRVCEWNWQDRTPELHQPGCLLARVSALLMGEDGEHE